VDGLPVVAWPGEGGLFLDKEKTEKRREKRKKERCLGRNGNEARGSSSVTNLFLEEGFSNALIGEEFAA